MCVLLRVWWSCKGTSAFVNITMFLYWSVCVLCAVGVVCVLCVCMICVMCV